MNVNIYFFLDGNMNMYMGNRILSSNSELLNETFYIYKAENDSSIQCGNIDSYNGKKTGVLKNDQRMVAVLEKLKSRSCKYRVRILYRHAGVRRSFERTSCQPSSCYRK